MSTRKRQTKKQEVALCGDVSVSAPAPAPNSAFPFPVSSFSSLCISCGCNPYPTPRKSRSSLSPSSSIYSPNTTESNNTALTSRYFFLCNQYATKPNCGVLATLKYGLTRCRPTPPFLDFDMIVLQDLICATSPPTTANFIEHLDLSLAGRAGSSYFDQIQGYKVRGIRSHGAVAIAAILQSQHCGLIKLQLDSNKIGGFGGEVIASALLHNKSIQSLSLQRCGIGVRGAESFANYINNHCSPADKNTQISLDLSLNMMGHKGIALLGDALQSRKNSTNILVDVDNNFVTLEVLNAVTHGLGFIFAVLGGERAFTI